MNSEKITVIQFMIFLFIYLFFKKQLDIIIDFKYPTYEKFKYANLFWKILVNLRRFLSTLVFLIILGYKNIYYYFIIMTNVELDKKGRIVFYFKKNSVEIINKVQPINSTLPLGIFNNVRFDIDSVTSKNPPVTFSKKPCGAGCLE